MALPDPNDPSYDAALSGGNPNLYNPAWGVALADPNQHSMVAQHFAANGIPPPAQDFDPDVDQMKAKEILGKHLKDQSQVPRGGPGPAPSGLQTQGTFEERFIGAPGSYLNPGLRSYTDPETGQGSDTPPYVYPPKPAPTTRSIEPKPPPKSDTVPPVEPAEPGKVPSPRPKPEPKTAIAPADGPNVAGSRPAGKRGEDPGRLGEEDPSPQVPLPKPREPQSWDEQPKPEVDREGKGNKEDAGDSFGKALAGLKAMQPPAFHFAPPGPIPHPGTQITRSTVPLELMKEISAIGKPGALLRLGQALKGR